MTRRPIAQVRVCVDVPFRANPDAIRTPGCRARKACVLRPKRIVAGNYAGGCERQAFENTLTPTVQLRGQIGAGQIRRRHQQRTQHARCALRHLRPSRDQMAPQAVRCEHKALIRRLRQHYVFKPRDPVAPQWRLPIVLDDALVTIKTLPTALPVQRVRVQPTWQEENFYGSLRSVFHYTINSYICILFRSYGTICLKISWFSPIFGKS